MNQIQGALQGAWNAWNSPQVVNGIKAVGNGINALGGNVAHVIDAVGKNWNDAVNDTFKGQNQGVVRKPAQQIQPMKQVMGQSISPIPTGLPKPTLPPYQHKMMIPNSQTGQPMQVPQHVAQALMSAFDNIKQATNAATVLHHPADNPYLSGDPLSVDHITYGENGNFITDVNHPRFDTLNSDGSTDRGLMRINNNSFNGIMAHPFFGKVAREQFGIKTYDDMKDPVKNAYMGKLIYERNSGWRGWYAAPRNLRAQGAPDLSALEQMIQQYNQQRGIK